jgi:aryl-alcohol dehydrogenase-like predicted oxidoreductase
VSPLNDGARSMKLGLGTAQFGIPYGATNAAGQVQLDEAHAIVRLALDNGIDLFDTAPGYGTAEQVISSVLPATAKVVTKTSIARKSSYGTGDMNGIRASILDSLKRLRRAHVHGLLLHSPDDLQRPGGELIIQLLLELRDSGVCEKVGISVYTQAQLEYCLRRYSLDLYQVPLSYVDQRIVRSGVLNDLANNGAEIHARSIFLQGVLLSAVEDLPQYFAPWRDKLMFIRDVLSALGTTPAAASLAFARSKTPASHSIVGATSVSELRELLHHPPADCALLPFDDFAIDDELFVNPLRWPTFRA